MSFIMQGVSPVEKLSKKRASDMVGNNLLVMTDYSMQSRFGCKGPQAAAWLNAQGILVPSQANTACLGGDGLLRVLRLGQNEFMVEADQARIGALYSSTRQPGVYPVLRQDVCIGLEGELLNALLLQTCNVNFNALSAESLPVVLTSMAGVSVTVMPNLTAAIPNCLIWCDGTFGSYLWQTLETIGSELGPNLKATSSNY